MKEKERTEVVGLGALLAARCIFNFSALSKHPSLEYVFWSHLLYRKYFAPGLYGKVQKDVRRHADINFWEMLKPWKVEGHLVGLRK
jgi:hypothetical protein